MTIDPGDLKRPARERILALLSDLEWHSYKEVHRTGSIRYSARLLELKHLGYQIETRENAEGNLGLDYRLVSLIKGAPQKKLVKVFLEEEDAKELSTLAERHRLDRAFQALDGAIKSFEINRHKL